MGVTVHYWALPPSSGLFQRLQSDRAFVTLMGSLFCHGNGLFFFFDEMPADEREEVLAPVFAERLLGSEPAARKLIEEFRKEVDKTRRAFPGIEQRRCSLEKTGQLVRERLPAALVQQRAVRGVLEEIRAEQTGRPAGIEHGQRSLDEHRLLEAMTKQPDDAAVSIVERLIYGDSVHAPFADRELETEEISRDPAFNCSGYVSLSLVKEGAEALSEVDAELTFINDRVWQLRDFRLWRYLYAEAAAHGEALCVGVC
jgi:hypothetical protein